MKETENKLLVKQFKDGSHNWWCGYFHYTLTNKELIFVCGGVETEELRNHMTKYLKTKKLL